MILGRAQKSSYLMSWPLLLVSSMLLLCFFCPFFCPFVDTAVHEIIKIFVEVVSNAIIEYARWNIRIGRGYGENYGTVFEGF